jgi:hypothetical protein
MPVLELVKNWDNTNDIYKNDQSVSAALRQSEINDIKNDFGIDIIAKMKNLLYNEFSQSLQKHILNDIYFREPQEDIYVYCIKDGRICFDELQLIKQLSEKLSHEMIGYDFIITNGKIGSLLQDSVQFEPCRVVNAINSAGTVHNSGTFTNIPLYIDPYMRYPSSDLFIGKKSIDFKWSVTTPILETSDNTGQGLIGSPRIVLDGSWEIGGGSKTKHIIVIDDKETLAKHKTVVTSIQREFGINILLNI